MNLYLLLFIISLLCAALQLPAASLWAEWHVTEIGQGQWWRIVTGNFTHTNFSHLVMNLGALWLIAWIFRPTWQTFTVITLVLSALVGLANLFTSMTVYVGLSGVLHGLFAYFALGEALSGRKSSWLLVAGVMAKVGYECVYGASQSTSALINARVAIEAHAFGLIGGLLIAILGFALTRRQRES